MVVRAKVIGVLMLLLLQGMAGVQATTPRATTLDLSTVSRPQAPPPSDAFGVDKQE